MNSLSEIRKDNGAFFHGQIIGNKVDRNGNPFQRSFYLSEKNYSEQFLAAVKYVDNFHGCSMIPNTSADGDDFPQKYLTIKNIIIYEKEARETPCVLYCWACVSNKKIFYKVGITATRHATDKSDFGLIRKRIGWTEENFYNARNGSLKIYPLFIVKSDLFGCQMLEDAIHRNPVFDGSISSEFKYFSGVSECCNFLDFDHLKQLRAETYPLNGYEWKYFHYLNKIDIEANKINVTVIHKLNYQKYQKDWDRLYNDQYDIQKKLSTQH